MNEEIKHLLNSHNISPPHTVQTEEEVVEYLLELNSKLEARLNLIKGVADGGESTHKLIIDTYQYRLVS